MTIQVICDCGRRFRVKAEHAGKRAKCPTCDQVLVIPQVDDADDQAFQMLANEPPTRAPTPPASPPVKPPPEAAEDLPTGYGFQEAPPESPAPPPPRKKARQVSTRSTKTLPEPVAPSGGARHYFYWLLLGALIPLAVSLFQTEKDDIKERLFRSIKNISPEKIQLLAAQNSLDDLLALLPDGRLEGAHLSRKTWIHWIYAFVSAGAFFGLILAIFPLGTANPRDLLLVGLFTATIGILFLLAVQFFAMVTQGAVLWGRSILVIVFWILKFIGFSYRCAMDPDNHFLLSFFGFTFGVGLCEEICKAIPLLVHFRRSGGMGWQSACLWGLATGVGFGVSEGIMYSSDFYNGIQTGGIYVVRFVSCVALHAIWSAAVAVTIYKNQALIQGDSEWLPYLGALVRMVAVPMIFHGLYDTLLKKEMNGVALVIALASFGWLAWQIEWTRHQEGETARAGLAATS